MCHYIVASKLGNTVFAAFVSDNYEGHVCVRCDQPACEKLQVSV